jgi:delta(3,5)-delta(2,4)-dienoyl-CoA isomerase
MIDSSRVAIKLYGKIKELQQSFLNVYECRVPVITGIHNLCIGGGIDLISTTDIRYCTKDS